MSPGDEVFRRVEGWDGCADANAVGANVTVEHLIAVVHDIAAVEVDDGVVFDPDSTSVQEIREHADYPGFRLRVGASIGPWNGTAAWDVSTDDPIVPAPRWVRIDRVLGDPILQIAGGLFPLGGSLRYKRASEIPR